MSLLCKKCCQTFVEDSGCLAHSTTCCENQWSEGGPLDFSDMLFIGAALLFLMSTVVSCQLVRPVRWSAWVEDPYVQKCPFEPASPETSCTDVQSGFLSMNPCSHGQYFSCEKLQGCFHRDVATYVPPVGQDSACAIVNNCPQTQCEASIGGNQPYHRQRASRYAPLCKVKSYQSSSVAVSQLDAPSSVTGSAERSSAAGNSDFSVVAASC